MPLNLPEPFPQWQVRGMKQPTGRQRDLVTTVRALIQMARGNKVRLIIINNLVPSLEYHPYIFYNLGNRIILRWGPIHVKTDAVSNGFARTFNLSLCKAVTPAQSINDG